MTLVKDTSLAYIVGVPELSFLANQVNSRLMVYPVQIFLVVAAIYVVLCTSLDWLATRLMTRHLLAETRRQQSMRDGGGLTQADPA